MNANMRSVSLASVILLLTGGSEIAQAKLSVPHAQNWIESMRFVRRVVASSSFDGFILENRKLLNRNRSDAQIWFQYGMVCHYYSRLKLTGGQYGSLSVDHFEDCEVPLNQAMRRAPESAAPLAGLYVHVNYFRERGMPEPNREPIEAVEVIDAQGRKHISQGYRIVSDAPKQRRLSELLSMMVRIDPENPLVLFCRGHAEKDPVKAIELLKKSIELVPDALYEFDAYALIKRKAEAAGDAETVHWVLKQVEEKRPGAPAALVKLAGF